MRPILNFINNILMSIIVGAALLVSALLMFAIQIKEAMER